MDVCGEHGNRAQDEIAFYGGNCPACSELEQKEQEWEDKRDELMNQLEDYVAQLDEKDARIEELEDEIESLHADAAGADI